MGTTAQAAVLAEAHGGVWGEHGSHPVADWQYEVGNNDTRLGYWEWVQARIDENEEGSN